MLDLIISKQLSKNRFKHFLFDLHSLIHSDASIVYYFEVINSFFYFFFLLVKLKQIATASYFTLLQSFLTRLLIFFCYLWYFHYCVYCQKVNSNMHQLVNLGINNTRKQTNLKTLKDLRNCPQASSIYK